MSEASTDASFQRIVEWAYNTLPEKIRSLPDFPGIQVADEPPADVLKDIRESRNWAKDRELLGLYSGFHRNRRQHFQLRIAPDLIFVFRGPILRCSRGNLPAEVKQVVWHEVAHWLGHDEREVKELGLSRSFKDIVHDQLDSEAPITVSQGQFPDTVEKEKEADERPRCIKCYSPDIACHEVERPLSYPEANSFAPISLTLHARRWACNSCGHEWDDEEDT